VTGVVIGESQSLGGHPIKVRRLNHLLSVAAQVTVPQIIGHDINDIGSLRVGRNQSRSDQGRVKDDGAYGETAGQHIRGSSYVGGHL
jgi:hypothetical protein